MSVVCTVQWLLSYRTFIARLIKWSRKSVAEYVACRNEMRNQSGILAENLEGGGGGGGGRGEGVTSVWEENLKYVFKKYFWGYGVDSAGIGWDQLNAVINAVMNI